MISTRIILGFICVLVLLVPVPSGASEKSNIRDVDFMDFSYRPECTRLLPDSGLPESLAVKAGLYETKPGLGGAYFKVIGVSYADLNSDGQDEAFIATECAFRGANYWVMEYFIYTLRDARPFELTSLNNTRVQKDYKRFFPDSDPWYMDEVKLDGTVLVVTLHADGPHCCPEYRVTLEYELDGKDLKLKGKPLRHKVE